MVTSKIVVELIIEFFLPRSLITENPEFRNFLGIKPLIFSRVFSKPFMNMDIIQIKGLCGFSKSTASVPVPPPT